MLAATVLSGQEIEKIYLSQLGTTATRSAIVDAFDEGASVMSYIGHGAIHLWANENLFNIGNVDSLSPQSQQPFLFTMTRRLMRTRVPSPSCSAPRGSGPEAAIASSCFAKPVWDNRFFGNPIGIVGDSPLSRGQPS